MEKKNIVYLHTGSNLGNREENLSKVNDLIAKFIGKIVTESRLYETEAWGVTNQPNFYNQALKVETNLKPQAILEKTLQIENEDFNRIRTEKWTARIIDIDILFYNDEVIKTDNLVIPHPHLHQRNFVLIPLMEIAGEMEHPILKETIEDLYWKSEDSLEVLIVED
ncbi:MAG: 2-amino-4-hydroxy-6-hydroxymethyldihydropteridine diphosphokinase [Saprospiraceae bacterium]|jgi:2-amino-4-hydroxy-6-hydroxymethyldihydropteridine diphosphokinase|tara:strand:+ start:250 stop:747 length:498 start_codon:yes stop_codon:yes gene_type:complete